MEIVVNCLQSPAEEVVENAVTVLGYLTRNESNKVFFVFLVLCVFLADGPSPFWLDYLPSLNASYPAVAACIAGSRRD